MLLDRPSVALDPSAVDVDVARFERLVAGAGPKAPCRPPTSIADGFEEWLTFACSRSTPR
jgi:hypothetical protein